MDDLDRKILSHLERDARVTMTDIAANVGLSLSACHRRFRDLESSGVIRGYRVDVDLERIGLSFEALVFVTMKSGDHSSIRAFENKVAEIPYVAQAHRLFGEPDYQLYVAAESKQHFQQLYDDHLIRLPGVQRLTSTLIMKTLVAPHSPLGKKG